MNLCKSLRREIRADYHLFILVDAVDALANERKKFHELEKREKELRDQFSAHDKNNKLGLIEAQGKLKHLAKENEKLQNMVKQLRYQIEEYSVG